MGSTRYFVCAAVAISACSSETLQLNPAPPEPPPAPTCTGLRPGSNAIPVEPSIAASGTLTLDAPGEMGSVTVELVPRDPYVGAPRSRTDRDGHRLDWRAEIIAGRYDVRLSRGVGYPNTHPSSFGTLDIADGEGGDFVLPVARWTLVPSRALEANQYIRLIDDDGALTGYSDTYFVPPGRYRAAFESTLQRCREPIGCGTGELTGETDVRGDVETTVDIEPVPVTFRITDGAGPVAFDDRGAVVLVPRFGDRGGGVSVPPGSDTAEAYVFGGHYDIHVDFAGDGHLHRVREDVEINGETVYVPIAPFDQRSRDFVGVARYDGGRFPVAIDDASIVVVDPTGVVEPQSMPVRMDSQTGWAEFRSSVPPAIYDTYYVPSSCPDAERKLPCGPARVLEGVNSINGDQRVDFDLEPVEVTVELTLDGEPLFVANATPTLRLLPVDVDLVTEFDVTGDTMEIGLMPGAYRVQLVGRDATLFGLAETTVEIEGPTTVQLDARTIQADLSFSLGGEAYAPVGTAVATLVAESDPMIELEWPADQTSSIRLVDGDYTLEWDAELDCADALVDDSPRACADHRILLCVE